MLRERCLTLRAEGVGDSGSTELVESVRETFLGLAATSGCEGVCVYVGRVRRNVKMKEVSMDGRDG